MAATLVRIAERAVREGLAVFQRFASGRRRLVVTEKSRHDYVTTLDREVESAIVGCLHRLRPGDAVDGEEGLSRNGTGPFHWYVDPIDGTRNLVAGRPEIAICVGVARGDRPIAGAVALPAFSSIVSGGIGLGPPSVSGGILVPRWIWHRATDVLIALPCRGFQRVVPSLLGRHDLTFRVSGALGFDLTLLACGLVDARLGGDFKSTDAVAGVALARSAGAVVLNEKGRPWRVGDDRMVAARNGRALRLLRESRVSESLDGAILPSSRAG